MHESYDDEDNDDYYEDNYDDSHDYDQGQSDWNKFYFKFDVTNSPLSDWVKKTIDNLFGDKFNLPEVPFVSFPVNNWSHNTESGVTPLYLGVNYDKQPIWKAKYFAVDKLQNAYIDHISSHPVHFIRQPFYYKGLFDILN
jgi:hypothetical protein